MAERVDLLFQLEDEVKLLRGLLERAYEHHTATSLPLQVERYGSRKFAELEGKKLWLVDIPLKLRTPSPTIPFRRST